MKVYLDDERSTPNGWVRVYWPDEAVELLSTGEVVEISLDHRGGRVSADKVTLAEHYVTMQYCRNDVFATSGATADARSVATRA